MKKTLLFLFIVIVHITWAQNGMTTKITVFKPDNSQPKSVTKADSMAGMEHNCIKWNYFLLGRGVFLLNYEFLITKNFTAEVGLGLTYSDFLFEALKGVNSDGTRYWENDGDPSPRVCGEGGLRYYFAGMGDFEGIYAGASLSYRPYAYPNSPLKDQYGSLVPGYNFLDAQFKIGYQYESRYSDFTYDVYIGIGDRNATLNYYVSEPNANGIGSIYVPQTIKESFPQFLFGTKIGYAF